MVKKALPKKGPRGASTPALELAFMKHGIETQSAVQSSFAIGILPVNKGDERPKVAIAESLLQ
jgi:hypothetical protein